MPEINRTAGHKYNPWADVVLAMLSVNNYPLTKTLELFDALKRKGLFDPRNLASWDQETIARRLLAAGYCRGEVMTAIFVERLSSLGALGGTALEAHGRILSEGTKEEVADLLAPVKGVGPKVLETFMRARGCS